MKLNEGTEIPDIFALWCGLSGISATLGRRVWLDLGTYKVYPNLFVVLVAGSGRCRKSTAIGLIEKLIRVLDPSPNLISQRITPEGLIDALRIIEKVEEGNGESELRKESVGFVVVDELSTFLNRKTYESGLASLLIPLYDCKENFEYRTKSRGKEIIKDGCLGILGATTIDWIRNAIPPDAVGGGLTSRIVFVYVGQPPPPVAITSFSRESENLLVELVRALEEIQTIRGQATMSEEAWGFYEEEYNRFYTDSPLYNTETLSGYASRRHVHLLKLGMLFAVSESRGEVKVERRHLEGALKALTYNEESLPRVLSLITATEKGARIEEVYRRISLARTVSRVEIMRSLSHKIDTRELTELLETLLHAKRIIQNVQGATVFYSAINPNS